MKEDVFSSKRMVKEYKLDPETTALLVVDMANDFLHEKGKMWLPHGHSIIAHVRELIDYSRNVGFHVIYINDCHRKDRYDIELDKRTEHCIEGSWGAQVVDELKPLDNDLVVNKRRYSGFFQTDLDLLLRENKVKTVIVVGLVTNICVRSTVHDAFFLGYNVIVPKSCVAAVSDREQESSLYDIDTHYGIVIEDLEALKSIIVK